MREIITREEAKKIGQKWYYTGEPCKYGHIDKRYVNTGLCYGCKRFQNKKQNKENCKSKLTCKKCGKEFNAPTWEKDRLYCSRTCQVKAIERTDIRTISNCKICGKEFKHYGEKIVCSRECLAKYMSQQRLNENNPAWIANKEKICARCETNLNIREEIYIKDKNQYFVL